MLALAGALVASSPAAMSVVVRNTPQLGWLAQRLPAPPLARYVEPTPGDPSQTGALYVPNGQGRWPGVLLVNGAEVPGGWRHPDVEAFARSIADLGLSVYVPDLPGFEGGSLTLQALEALEQDVTWFSASEHVSGGRVSLVGVCVGGSLAIVVAERPAAAGNIRSVVAIDPYSQIRNAIESATTGQAPGIDGRVAPFRMVPWVRAAMVRSLSSTIPDQPSRDAVLQALESSPEDDPLQGFRRTPSDTLSPTAAAWWELLGNTDAARFQRLYQALPENVRSNLDELSPAGRIGRVSVPVLIAAPYHDFAFPAGDATELQRGNPRWVHLTRTSALDHVTPTIGPGVLRDYWQLWRFAASGIAAFR
jgi:dienelactone hydrolase